MGCNKCDSKTEHDKSTNYIKTKGISKSTCTYESKTVGSAIIIFLTGYRHSEVKKGWVKLGFKMHQTSFL